MCLQKRTSNSRNVTADNAEKRINGDDKTAAEFMRTLCILARLATASGLVQVDVTNILRVS